MQNQFEATIDAPIDQVFPIVADLARYPEFLEIVSRVEPHGPTVPGTDGANGDHDDGDQAWWVTLRAKIGPFARSKRLRMVRSVARPNELVRFERAEVDGRDHSRWTLEARVAPGGGGNGDAVLVTMALDYSGGLWSGAVDAVLRAEAAAATERLRHLATAA